MKTHISKLIIVIMMLCTITVYAQNKVGTKNAKF